MNLHLNRCAAFLIQYLETVDKCHGNDGAFGFCSSAEAATVEFTHFIAVFAPGTLGENQIISTGKDFFGHILNDG